MILTPELLSAAIPGADTDRWLQPANDAAKRHGITDPIEFAFWLAHTAHETQGLTRMEESFAYTAERLAQVWPARFSTSVSTSDFEPNRFAIELAARGPKAIANYVYANRMGNGGLESGDGWQYRGRGWSMLTGKDNHLAFWRENAISPDALGVWADETYALAGAWYWVKHGGKDRAAKALDPFASRGCFIQDVRALNGGTINLDDRLKRWKIAMRAFGFEV